MKKPSSWLVRARGCALYLVHHGGLFRHQLTSSVVPIAGEPYLIQNLRRASMKSKVKHSIAARKKNGETKKTKSQAHRPSTALGRSKRA